MAKIILLLQFSEVPHGGYIYSPYLSQIVYTATIQDFLRIITTK